jgi:hypothetical protein
MEEYMSVVEGRIDKKKVEKGPWSWFMDIFIHPRAVFTAIAQSEKGVWLKPMLVLTALVVILSLSAGPARLLSTQMNAGLPPDDFQYWSEEQQNQFFEGQMAMQSPLFIYIFPLLGSLVGLWLGWFAIGSILHLLMTFAGSRQPQGAYLNLAAWAALPFAIRSIVQIIAVIATKQVIDDPGLSGFITAGQSGGLDLVRILLGMVDIYALGFAALVLLGAPIVSGLKVEKSLWVTALALAIFVIMAALPGFFMGQFNGLGTIQPLFLF